MLTKEEIADCGWTHGDHCECERCDRRLAVMREAVLAYSRVAALADEFDALATPGRPDATAWGWARDKLLHALNGG